MVAAVVDRRYRPKASLTVSQWAQMYRGYDPRAAPWQSEIMDALGDPMVSEVGLMGPAQQGKTEIGLAWVGWSIDHDIADMLICQPSRDLADEFAKTRIGTMVRQVAVLRDALLPMVNADNIHLKMFRGCSLRTIWPVAAQFRQRPARRGWLDDFDEIPDDIEGQGSAIGLLDSRAESFEGRDTKLVTSSPAREDGSGIEAFVERGSDERLMPVCPSCGERIELNLLRDLKFKRTASIDHAAATAEVVCPASGCILSGADQRRLIDSLYDLPQRGWVASRPENGRRRRTFRLDGLLGFKSWAERARQWREAELEYENRQDEGALRAFVNTKAGYNYRSKASGEKPIEAATLLARREAGWKLGTVPRGPKVLNLTIDVQHDRFECAVVGTGRDRETWLVDRFAVHVLDDGLTAVMPFRHKEHWRALLPLFDRKVPLAETGADGKPVGHAPILSVTIDIGGSNRDGDAANEGAKYFYEAAISLGVNPSRITLVKGGSNRNEPRLMKLGQFADQKLKGGPKRRSARLWIANVHRIKNVLDARLRRQTPGPGYIHLPEDFSEEHAAELTAEQLKAGKWEKQRARNETWDLMVYAEAAILKPPFAQSQNNMRWIPRGWGVAWPRDDGQRGVAAKGGHPAAAANAVLPVKSGGPDSQADVGDAPAVARRQSRRRPPRARAGWMGRLKS